MRLRVLSTWLLLAIVTLEISACHKRSIPVTKRQSTFGRAQFFVDQHGLVKEPIKELMRLTGVPVVDSLQSAVAETQKSWIRQKGLERAHLLEGFLENRATFITQFERLGIVRGILPKEKVYDYVILLGAMYESFQRRLQFLEELLVNGTIKTKRLALLGSHRPLEQKQEVEPLLKSRTFVVLPLTEIDMMQALLDGSKLKEVLAHTEIITVASPMKINAQGQPVRANTRDTFEDLDKNPLIPGPSLVISSQPYVLRQDLVARSVLKDPWHIETVGPRADEQTATNVYVDEVARTLFEINNFYF